MLLLFSISHRFLPLFRKSNKKGVKPFALPSTADYFWTTDRKGKRKSPRHNVNFRHLFSSDESVQFSVERTRA
jgi:hypothetical protein